MRYNQPFGVSDPNAAYVNGNPALGVQGSIPPASAFEYPQREILAVIEHAGIIPSNADLTQLLQALQWMIGNAASTEGRVHYGEAGGTANAITATMSPALADLAPGRFLLIKVATANTGAVTLNADGHGALPITKPNGDALEANDLVAGQVAVLVTGIGPGPSTRFELVSAVGGAGVSEASLLHYGVDTSVTANTVTAATINPAVTSTPDGMVFLVKIANTNTGASTFNPASLGAAPIVNSSGGALSANTLIAGGIAMLVRNGSNYQFVGMLPDSGFQANLSQNGYVRFANGFTIQWGRHTSPANYQTNVTITWPIAFTDAVYIAIANTGYLLSGGSVNVEPNVISLTQCQFHIHNHVNQSGTLSTGFHYIAIGK